MTQQANISATLCVMTRLCYESRSVKKYITTYLPYNSFTIKGAGRMESKLRNTIMSV